MPVFLAVDIGNSRVKFGRFEPVDAAQLNECQQSAQSRPLPIAATPTGVLLPEPVETLTLDPPLAESTGLADWLDAAGEDCTMYVASVHRGVTAQLRKAIQLREAVASRHDVRLVELASADLPIETRVDQPERVGADRLLAALAANQLRRKDRAAIVVDLGTAITVDLVAADGVFEGGAILPGIGMASRALDEQTDALPNSGLVELDASPDAVGKNTAGAIHAGLFWGAVGAVRELIARQSDRLTQPPQVYLTGGAAPSVARLLGGPDIAVRYLPNLVLSGIAVAAGALEATE